MKLRCFFLFVVLGFLFVNAQQKTIKKQQFIINNDLSYEYTKPKLKEMFKYIPNDLTDLGKYLISKENFSTVALTTYSTAALIPFDPVLSDEAAAFGKPLNLDNEGTYFRIKGVRMLPSNAPAAIYFIGNGGATLLISGGFYAFGKINNDYRMLTTSSEIVEGFITTALVSQTVKRITGRQSPVRAFESNNPAGNWTLFPSFSAFKSNTPNYDAIPSGHLATYMTTLTIITTNYPEVKWVKPVGYTLGGLLAFQMVSSNVHWTSDYPLAVLFGYIIGKNIANRRINKIKSIKIGQTEMNYKAAFSLGNIDGYSTLKYYLSF